MASFFYPIHLYPPLGKVEPNKVHYRAGLAPPYRAGLAPPYRAGLAPPYRAGLAPPFPKVDKGGLD